MWRGDNNFWWLFRISNALLNRFASKLLLTHWACLHISLLKRGAEFLNHFLEYDCLNPCFLSNLLPTHLVKPSLASRYKENYSLRHTKFSIRHKIWFQWNLKLIFKNNYGTPFFIFHILDAFEPNYHKVSIECTKKKQTSMYFYMILWATYFKVKVKNIRLH